MTKLSFLSRFVVLFPFLIAVGCGGGVAPGVADGPDEEPPAMTEEEEATEAESARNAAAQ